MTERIKVSKKVVVENEEVKPIEVRIEKPKWDFEKISFYTLATLVFLTPLFFLPVSFLGLAQTKITLFSLGTLLALCFYIIDKIRKGRMRIVLQPIYITAGLVALTYFISAWIGIGRYKSLMGGLIEGDTFHIVFIGFIFMFLISRLARNGKQLFTILSLFMVSIAIAMLSQILRIAIGAKLFGFGILNLPSDTLVGSWGDLTVLSLFFLATLVILLEMLKLKKWIRTASSLLIILPFFFVIISGLSFDLYFFNVGLLMLIAISSIIIFAYLYSLRRASATIDDSEILLKKKSKFPPSLIMLFISIVLVVFGGQINTYLSSATGISYVEGRPNWQSTYDIASKVIAQKPFFGSGPNTFDVEWNLNKSPEVNNYIFWNNEFTSGVGAVPTAATTTGLVGFILWILFYFFVFSLAIRTLFASRKSENVVMSIVISVGAILSSLVMFFYSSGFILQFANLLFIGLLLAAGQSQYKMKNFDLHGKQWKNFVSTILFVLILIVSLYWMYIVALKAVGNHYYRSAVLSTDTTIALTNIKKAISLDPTQSLYYETAAQVYATKVSEMMSLSNSELGNKKDEINGYIVNAVNYAVTAENIDPNDYKTKVVTGKILEFFGSIGLKDANDGAIQKYAAAGALTPTNPLPLLFAANVAMNTNNKPLARTYLTKAITLKSDYSDTPELGKEIQGLIDELNKSVAPVVKDEATTTSKTKESGK
ncbi:MAG: hypothetical protein V4509_03600 [Patescibacteria group bacterium]